MHLSVGCMIRDEAPDLSGLDVCEFSAHGPLVEFLERSAGHAAFSEYSSEVERGSFSAGVRNEDVQRLTYADESFDLITHSEIMEHVPDDAAAFCELRRVLRNNGCMIFTVPLSAAAVTVERVRLDSRGQVEHLLEPAYHTDPWRAGDGILVFRDYGKDVVDRLNAAGFSDVVIRQPMLSISWIALRYVIVARP
ncbi:MAG: methyltransferase domain-containing protein [Dokdonella sp.]